MLQFIFNRSFFKDRTMLILLVPVALLFVASFLLVAFNIESRSFPLFVRYSGFDGVVQSPQREQWQALWVLPIFSLVTLVGNVALAVKVQATRRDIAIGILVATAFIGLISIMVGWSLLSLNKLI